MKLLKRLFFFSLLFLLLAKPAFAAIASVSANDKGFATLQDLTVVFANIVSVVSTLVGFAVLIQLIRGGISYITSMGDPKAIATARSTLTWAIIGMIVIIASYLIISLILGFVSLPGIGQFCIPQPKQDAFTQCPLYFKK